MSEFKEKYNKTINRYKKAEEYMDKCTEEQFEKWCPEFQNIIVELSALLKEYEELIGKPMTQEQVLNGF